MARFLLGRRRFGLPDCRVDKMLCASPIGPRRPSLRSLLGLAGDPRWGENSKRSADYAVCRNSHCSLGSSTARERTEPADETRFISTEITPGSTRTRRPSRHATHLPSGPPQVALYRIFCPSLAFFPRLPWVGGVLQDQSRVQTQLRATCWPGVGPAVLWFDTMQWQLLTTTAWQPCPRSFMLSGPSASLTSPSDNRSTCARGKHLI